MQIYLCGFPIVSSVDAIRIGRAKVSKIREVSGPPLFRLLCRQLFPIQVLTSPPRLIHLPGRDYRSSTIRCDSTSSSQVSRRVNDLKLGLTQPSSSRVDLALPD